MEWNLEIEGQIIISKNAGVVSGAI